MASLPMQLPPEALSTACSPPSLLAAPMEIGEKDSSDLSAIELCFHTVSQVLVQSLEP